MNVPNMNTKNCNISGKTQISGIYSDILEKTNNISMFPQDRIKFPLLLFL